MSCFSVVIDVLYVIDPLRFTFPFVIAQKQVLKFSLEVLAGLSPTTFNYLTAMDTKKTTNRRIRSNILGDTGCRSYCVMDAIAENARGGGFLAKLACATGKHESVVDSIFFGVKHVRA